MPHIARRFASAGADGLVLINRFYQPDFDLETLLYGRIEADFALTSGVHTAQDLLKAIMAAASVTMMASTRLEHGIGRLMYILADLQSWMDEHEYMPITEMKGSMSQRAVAEPAAFERANYLKTLNAFQS